MEMGSGLDFATFMNSALRNGNCGDNMWGGQNGLLWIFLLLLFGWGGNGYGNRGQAVNETVEAAIQKARADGVSDSMLMDAIKGNQSAIQTLANTFNTDITAVQQALCALNGGLDKISGQIGLSGQQVINAIQTGNMNIVQQLMNCCCDIRENLATGFNSVKINAMEQTNTLSDRMRTGFTETHQLIGAQTAQMVAGFQSIKDMFTQNKIDTLQATVNQLQNNANNSAQTAYLQNYINSQLAPVQTGMNTLMNRVPSNPVPAVVVGNASTGGYAYGGWNNSCCGCMYGNGNNG